VLLEERGGGGRGRRINAARARPQASGQRVD
jgi:hypothetical protein